MNKDGTGYGKDITKKTIEVHVYKDSNNHFIIKFGDIEAIECK